MLKGPSRPLNEDDAPRPQSAIDGPPSSGAAVSENAVCVSTSRPVMLRSSARASASRSSVPASHCASRSASRSAAASWSPAAAVPPVPLSFAAPGPAADPEPGAQDGSACPPSVAWAPAARGASSLACTLSTTCSATVRPNRASHAFGILSVFSIVPVASRSPSRAPATFESRSRNVSCPSSWPSSRIGTDTVFTRSPAAKVSVPVVAV